MKVISPMMLMHPSSSLSVNRGFYISVHVLLNLSNDLRKRDNIQGLSNISSLFCNEFKMH